VSAAALFIDRDGTLVHARDYPRRPDELVLHDGVARELARLRGLGMRIVLVSNQSGVARGLLTEDDLVSMHAHLGHMLAAEGARLDAIYCCPHAPADDGRASCECRKPLPGMFFRAARDLELDLGSSWMVGDILDDIEAAHRAGCRAVLVDRGTETLPASGPLREPEHVANTTAAALRFVGSRITEVERVA
jgi:D-glycero-D-manno-heptose 1,7-bisphosphate phosphatase